MKRAAIGGAVVAAAGAVAVFAGLALRDDDEPAAAPATTIRQTTAAELAAAGLGELLLAPAAKRVDLVAPPFLHPTEVTNPLFPIAALPSAILAGTVEGKPFKTETTLLPETRIVDWPKGRPTRTLVSQYVAYVDGQIEEVALDLYAQADDGSVWYFGEDVFNYEDGRIADTEGTWVAGKEGPAAMIMPAHPRVGDAYRTENVPGLVFEEVHVEAVGRTVPGPHGPVAGAIVAGELHEDGAREDKIFAPGYGEFFTGADGEVEAMALALPADRLSGQPPRELATLSAAVETVLADARPGRWHAAAGAVGQLRSAWRALDEHEVPPRLRPAMTRALAAVTRAVDERDAVEARRAAIDVAQSALDIELRHRAPVEVDQDRFALWARRLAVDAASRDGDAARGDVATLEWIRDRIAHALGQTDRVRLDAALVNARALVTDEEYDGLADEAQQLAATVSR